MLAQECCDFTRMFQAQAAEAAGIGFDELVERIKLLSTENAQLRAEMGAVKDRLANVERIVTDAGYRGHHAPQEKRFQVYVAGQKRGLSPAIKRAFRRRSPDARSCRAWSITSSAAIPRACLRYSSASPCRPTTRKSRRPEGASPVSPASA